MEVLNTALRAAGYSGLTPQKAYVWRKVFETRGATCPEVERAFWLAVGDPQRYGKDIEVRDIVKHIDAKRQAFKPHDDGGLF
jgi:hypothetical protein